MSTTAGSATISNAGLVTVTGLTPGQSATVTVTTTRTGYTGGSATATGSAAVDSDGDGVPDTEDAFPNDPTESADSDGDGVGDNADAFPNDPTESADSDGDGVGDNTDAFPNAATAASSNGVTLQTTPPSKYSGCSVASLSIQQDVPTSYLTVATDGNGVGVNFSLSGCSTNSPETLTVSVDLGTAPAEGSVAYKIDADGVWTAIPGATINGSVVTYSITDNDGVLDQNGELGKIRDPMTVARPYSTPLTVPTLPGTLLGLLALVMAGLGWRRLV